MVEGCCSGERELRRQGVEQTMWFVLLLPEPRFVGKEPSRGFTLNLKIRWGKEI